MLKQELPEYRTGFMKRIFTGEALNISESRALQDSTDGKSDTRLQLPTDYENALIDYTRDKSPILKELENVYSIDTGPLPFTFFVSNIVDDENTLTAVKLDREVSFINSLKISNHISRSNPERIAKAIFKQLSLKTVRDVEAAIVADDGTKVGVFGLPFAGSGTDGAYVADTDLVETAAVSEANLLSVIGMVNKPNAKWIMSESFFYTNVFPLMALSKLIIQANDGQYYIGTHRVIFSNAMGDSDAYLADLSYFGGNIIYEYGVGDGFLAANRTHAIFTTLQIAPAVGMKAFAKLSITAGE